MVNLDSSGLPPDVVGAAFRDIGLKEIVNIATGESAITIRPPLQSSDSSPPDPGHMDIGVTLRNRSVLRSAISRGARTGDNSVSEIP